MTVKRQVKSDEAVFAILLEKLAACLNEGLSQFHGVWRTILAMLLFGFTGVHASWTAADDPMQILQKTRQIQASQYRTMEGQVRREGTVIPFRVTLDGGEIKYEFSNPDQTLVLQLGEKGSRLVEVTKKGTDKIVTDAQYDKTVRGTDITYEDLSMRFLYWPIAKIAGEEVRLTRNCWKLRVEPGSLKSQYGYVMLWIEKQSSGLVRVETYDKADKMLKRFEATSVQKSEGGYILKQMRIQKVEDGKFGQPTYLEINKPD